MKTKDQGQEVKIFKINKLVDNDIGDEGKIGRFWDDEVMYVEQWYVKLNNNLYLNPITICNEFITKTLSNTNWWQIVNIIYLKPWAIGTKDKLIIVAKLKPWARQTMTMTHKPWLIGRKNEL